MVALQHTTIIYYYPPLIFIFLPANPEQFYLELTIKDPKTKINILKRKLNYFENVYDIIETKENDRDYIWALKCNQTQKEMNISSSKKLKT